MKKLVNIYDLEQLKKLSKNELFFLANALNLNPVMISTQRIVVVIIFIIFVVYVKKIFKLKITFSQE
jgi:hypothetical protein